MAKGYKKDGSFAGKVFIKGCLAPKTAFKKGQVPWNKGLKGWNNGHPNFLKAHTEEAKLKISKNNSRWNKGKKGLQVAWNKGIKLPQFSGKNNPNWKGGITPINIRLRQSLDYEEWRKKVFERDLYTCQKCGEIGGKLNADHIKPWSLYPELRFDINNGRTLCQRCHKLTPTYLRFGLKREEFEQCQI